MNIGNLTKAELIDLGERLLNASNEKDSDSLYRLFNDQFSHPDAANLFFYPENDDMSDISDYNPSVEEVVDIAIAHEPIKL